MSTAAKRMIYTFDEFCELVKDGEKADLIDGVIYMASPENTDANLLGGWLYALMLLIIQHHDLGKVFISRVAFRLGDSNGPEPDIAFVSKDRLAIVKRGRVEGAADLAVEVVSPDSVDRDYRQKRRQFEQAGTREYWIIDELQETVTWLRLDKKGKYRAVRPRLGKLTSNVLPGFWLRPTWLWQRPMPQVLEVFQEITKDPS
jgi:Uma2 family endonuclease